ncbi:MAG: OmpA family protein, partial [Halioglobus sp.]|nr:OmpA family protein [Halioglobus sp.]
LAGEVIPASPAANPQKPEEPIEELGILPSEQWERDGTLIDWERDVAQPDTATTAAAVPGEDLPAASSNDAPAVDAGNAVDTVPVAATIAELPEPLAVQPLVTTEPDVVADDASVPLDSDTESAQLLALLNEEAAASTYSLTFGFDSIALSTEARDILARVLEKLVAEPGLSAHITGFADYQGSESYNLHLSIERARAVREHLIAAGVPQERLVVSGRGAQPKQGDVGLGKREQLRAVQIRLLDSAN